MRSSFLAPVLALSVASLLLSSCSSDTENRDAAPLGSSEEQLNVEFGFSKSTRVCVINKSWTSIEVTFTRKDNSNGEGSLNPGDQACGDGTFMDGDDITGAIRVPKWNRTYTFGAVNTNGGIPSAALQVDGCPETRSTYFENASGTNMDGVLKFTTKRLKDTSFKEFTITVSDEAKPASSPSRCW